MNLPKIKFSKEKKTWTKAGLFRTQIYGVLWNADMQETTSNLKQNEFWEEQVSNIF